ncbi:NTE family protein [Geodermatophilus telluris]|uniref:NTE family protein n=1 Tax=Geodermatophilus telluris TaxID=1190417 RepID=A0A1G6SZM1_9ACTN|nr:patatin-like phospholipase family protein [Geodermatophilus telluris]SDD22199.1 NTE family protein [Geodermatophilus telluris]
MSTNPHPTPPIPTTPAPTPPTGSGAGGTALVLGGGGSTGNAWLIGVVAGLLDGGLDVTDADLLVGTSAGATAAAQLTGATPADLLDGILSAPPPGTGPGAPGRSADDHLAWLQEVIATAGDAADLRRRVGAALLERTAASDGSGQARWRATVAARLPVRRWPDRRLLLTAVDARTGEPVVLDRHSGVDLVDAVAASCAGGFAYGAGGRWYVDGGYRANAENADLAAGCARVLVLSPLGGRALTPVAWGTHLTTQVAALRAGGSRVGTVVPDGDSGHLFGANALDVSLRPLAARAGYDRGRALAGPLADLWL